MLQISATWTIFQIWSGVEYDVNIPGYAPKAC